MFLNCNLEICWNDLESTVKSVDNHNQAATFCRLHTYKVTSVESEKFTSIQGHASGVQGIIHRNVQRVIFLDRDLRKYLCRTHNVSP